MLPVTPADGDGDRDRGAILVLTLVLCVVLAVVATALAGFAAAALRSSRVTDGRTERREAAEAGLRLGVEMVKASRATCALTSPPTLSVGPVNGATVAVTCTVIGTGPSDYRTLQLDAVADDGAGTTSARAVVQHASSRLIPGTGETWTAINSWEVLG